jgi:hypothetical protein
MTLLYTALTAISVLTLSSCAGVFAREPAPAVLVNSSEDSRAELSRVIGEALHRPAVMLSPDALTRESSLIIEPVRPRDDRDMLLNGRELGRPEHFRLVKEGARCILIQEGMGRRWTLSLACRPTAERVRVE